MKEATKRESPMTTVAVYLIERALSKELAPKANLATLNDRPTIRVMAWVAELAPPFNLQADLLKERNSRVLDYLFF